MPNPRTPETIKRLRGTARADRAPKPTGTPVLLTPPDWLSQSAALVWQETAPLLYEAGLSTVLDHACLGRYCWAEAERRTAEQKQLHPLAMKYGKLAADLAERLGLSPTSRQRLPMSAPKAEPSDLAKLLG